MKKAAVATLGCKVNQVETSAIAYQLGKRGYELVDFTQDADIYIINTCTVTGRTDYKSRNLIRQALHKKTTNPLAKVIVTGCYAQKEIEEIMAMGEIDLVVDNQNKTLLEKWLDNQAYHFQDISAFDAFPEFELPQMYEHTRAFLKIQDGCDYFCAYCAVPFGRGKPRSMAFTEVIRQARLLVQNGYQEIVLTGINLGMYKDDETGKKLPDVLQALVQINGLNLLRISSIEPDLWTTDLLTTIADNQMICPHFHIPIQSGSDAVLSIMGRHYRFQDVRNLLYTLKSIRPDCAIGLDIICGFPNETDKEFEETYQLISELPIAYLHIFPYSKRSQTAAALLPNQLSNQIKKERTKRMQLLNIQKKTEYIQLLLEQKVILQGIAESESIGYYTALSDHYVRIYYKAKEDVLNSLFSGTAWRPYQEGVIIT